LPTIWFERRLEVLEAERLIEAASEGRPAPAGAHRRR
jgi:hypothetical protein